MLIVAIRKTNFVVTISDLVRHCMTPRISFKVYQRVAEGVGRGISKEIT